MVNVVEIVVKTKDEVASGLKASEKAARDSGSAAGKGFSDSFGKAQQNAFSALDDLFRHSDSVLAAAQAQGANVGRSFAKGLTDELSKRLKEADLAGHGRGALKGIGVFAGGSGLLSMAAPLGAAGVAAGAFGAIAAGAFSKANASLKTLQAAEKAYNSATTPKAKEVALLKVKAAQDALTGSQRQLLGQEEQLKGMWNQFVAAMTPVVVEVTKFAVTLAKGLMPVLGPLVTAGAKVVEAFLKPLDTLIKSMHFDSLIGAFGKFAVQVGNLVGPQMTKLLDELLTLFVKLMPSGVQILSVLLPLFVQIVGDLSPVIVVIAKVTAAVLTWLQQTGLLKPVLLGLVPVIMLLVGSTGIGAILIAISLLVAGIVELSRHWKQVWGDIKQWTADAWNFLTHGWGQFLVPGLTLIRVTVEFVRDHWRAAWNAITGAMSTAWNTIKTFLDSLAGKIEGVFKGAGTWLYSFGKSILTGLLNGIKSVWNAVITFFKNLPADILHALGIHSPPDWAIEAGQHIMNGLGLGMTMAHKVVSEATAAAIQNAAETGVNAGGPGGGAPSANAALAKKMYPEWSKGAEWTAWNNVAMRESGWNSLAHNASGAFGIAQALGHGVRGGGGKYGNQYGGYGLSLAGDRNANNGQPAAQIQWMHGYIKAIYGDPIGAWNQEVRHGYYGAGGATSAGWAVVGEHGRELVKLPGGAIVRPHGQSEQALAGGMGGAAVVHIEVSGGQSAFDQFMLHWLRENARIKGGGSVQKAFGRS